MKTKTSAIKHARQIVSTLSPIGGGYYFATYNEKMNAWWQHVAKPYHAAAFDRSQALIDAARNYLDLPPVQYDGGAWIDYV